MWEPTVIISIAALSLTIMANAVAITVVIVKLGGKIDVNHTSLTGKIDVMGTRLGNVETNVADLKNTDRRLSLVEDRQAALATRQGNMEQDNLLIREDLSKLHQGLDRHNATLARFNDGQFSKPQ